MAAHLADGHRGERLRAGVTIAVIGAPNVGKSSLVNLLARREVAIVTPIAGTTRDVIEVQLDLAGVPVTLLDTAGLRESSDPIEREGIARAKRRAEAADLRVLVVDAAASELPQAADEQALLVVNKTDLAPGRVLPAGAVGISCQSGEGIADLLGGLAERAGRLVPEGDAALLTRARHRDAVEEARAALARFQDGAASGAELALLAEDLRLAARAIGRITGAVGVEDVLDRIFATFCIGK
jgi:tRNA modification GTPase